MKKRSQFIIIIVSMLLLSFVYDTTLALWGSPRVQYDHKGRPFTIESRIFTLALLLLSVLVIIRHSTQAKTPALRGEKTHESLRIKEAQAFKKLGMALPTLSCVGTVTKKESSFSSSIGVLTFKTSEDEVIEVTTFYHADANVTTTLNRIHPGDCGRLLYCEFKGRRYFEDFLPNFDNRNEASE